MFRTQGGTACMQISADIELSNLQGPVRRTTTIEKPSWARRQFTGWRFGVLSGVLLAMTVLVLNLVITLQAMKWKSGNNNSPTDDDGLRLLFEGDCKQASQLNVLAHLLINAMSTVLLSASNYGMQVLSAPTRSEVDSAHARRRWLDIGVLSVRNIKSINQKRAWMWGLLGASSLPLHLLYNSAVFSTVTAHEYVVYSATPDMVSGTDPDMPLGSPLVTRYDPPSGRTLGTIVTMVLEKARNGGLERLTVSECIDQYAVNFQTDRRNLILVTNDTNQLHSAYVYDYYSSAIHLSELHCPLNPFAWICGNDGNACLDETDTVCPEEYKGINRDDWRPFKRKIEYCLSEKMDGLCKVQFSSSIAWMVITFNASKVAILLGILLFVGENPLTTMGDAMASFVSVRDETTAGLCLMSRDRIALWNMAPVPQPYTVGTGLRSRKWSNVISRNRWWFCMFLYALAIGTCTILFFYGIVGKQTPARTLMSIPIGSVHPATFIFGWAIRSYGEAGVVGNALVANTPQVILSMIYYTYNSLFTCFLAGREWASYAMQRKGLRVSAVPYGQQRSTYFLQLPYKIAFPLMVLSGLLHWLTSQSIFLVSMQEVTILAASTHQRSELITCGYSPPAILAVVLVGLLMVAMVSYFGTRTFEGGMPIVATASACISAFCHVDENDVDAAYAPLQWGISGYGDRKGEAGQSDVFSHCTFSSRHVRLPEEGELCAGSIGQKKGRGYTTVDAH